MERLSASISSVRGTLSNRSDASKRDTILAHLAKCAVHFRAELTEVDAEIYLAALAEDELPRIEAAFERCLCECEFMPKLRDLYERMPEKGWRPLSSEEGKVVREWYEPYYGNKVLHYFEHEDGGKRVRIEEKA